MASTKTTTAIATCDDCGQQNRVQLPVAPGTRVICGRCKEDLTEPDCDGCSGAGEVGDSARTCRECGGHGGAWHAA